MQFKFIGDPRGGPNPDAIAFGGVVFPLDVAISVDDPVLRWKLTNNSHFEVVGGGSATGAKRGRPRKETVATVAEVDDGDEDAA